MAGLSHYKNSMSSINKFEPVFLNQFEVLVTPPAGVLNGNLLLEQVTNISGLDVDKNPSSIEQRYKFANRNFAGAKPDKTTLDLAIKFNVNLDDVNSMFTFKTLRQWTDLIYNPLTGAQGLKRDYTGTIVVSIFNKQGDVFRRITCRDVFPTAPITDMSLSYESSEIFSIDMKYASDYFDDVFL